MTGPAAGEEAGSLRRHAGGDRNVLTFEGEDAEAASARVTLTIS
jgi:hypothetical protein